MQECSKHGADDIRNGKCGACNREYQRKWFAKNREEQIRRTKESREKRLAKLPPKPPKPPKPTHCAFPNCDRPHKNMGFCGTHYDQQRSGKALTPISSRLSTNGLCAVLDCRSRIFQVGLCKRHFRKQVRHNRRSAKGSFTGLQLAQRFSMFGNRCWLCGCDGEMVVEHVKPIDAGGSNWPSNLRPACFPCNSRKGNRWYGVALLSRLVEWVVVE